MQRLKKSDLGPLINIYRGRRLRWRDLFIVFLPGTLAVFIPLIYGIWVSAHGYSQHGPVAASSWSRPWFVLAAISILCLLFLALIRIYNAHTHVSVYKYGLFVYTSPLQQFALPWSKISGIATSSEHKVFLSYVILRKYRITLFLTISKAIILDQRITNILELGECIKTRLYPKLILSLQNEFQNERWLHFGPLSCNKNFIFLRNKRIPWKQVSRVLVQAGFLKIELKNKEYLLLQTSQIPNIELFFRVTSWGISS